jgi:hypothetical protein
LSPAKVSSVKINEEAKTAEVFLKIESSRVLFSVVKIESAIQRFKTNIKFSFFTEEAHYEQ